MNPTNPTTLSQGPAWRSRAAAAALLALATNLSAQSGQVTAPVESSASGSIWRAGQNRVQCIYDSTLFTGQGVARAVLIDRLRWRSAAGVFGAATSYPAVDIWLGDSAADVLAPSTSFASNRTAGHTLVYSGPVSVVPAVGTTPNTFTIDLPLATPFRYDPVGLSDLLLEIVIHGNPTPNVGTTMATSSSAATYLANTVRSIGSVTALTGSVSSFCPVVEFGYSMAVSGPVVINEFVYDDTGTDNREFVELYNRSATIVDLSGWQVTAADAQGANPGYVIPTGTMLAPGAFYVLGSPQVAGANLVVGTTNLWEDDTESLTLRDAQGRIVDTLVYESHRGVWDPNLSEGDGLWGETISTDGVASAWGRCPDGRDVDNNGRDFWLLPVTPGQSNSMYVSLPYTRDFDAQAPGSVVAGWSAGVLAPHAVDPTQVGPYNPVALPPSPQGGLVAAFGDATGVGNANALTAAVTPGQVFDAWVYLDASPALPGQPRSWSVGFGSSAGIYRTPDPSGSLGLVENGNTGISWTYQVVGTQATLYLVNHHDGGWGAGARTAPLVVGQIAITAGVNDGWQRLRLHRLGTETVGSMGDGAGTDAPIITADPQRDGCCARRPVPCCTYQCLVNWDGQCLLNATPNPNDFAFVAVSNTVLHLDSITVTGSTASIATSGTSSPSSLGRGPVILPNTPPVVGNSLFGVTTTQLLPNNLSVLLIGFSPQVAPFPGSPPTSAVLANPAAILALFSDGNGRTSYPLALPEASALIGLSLSWQSIDVDSSLPFGIPIANSRVLTTTLGAF